MEEHALRLGGRRIEAAAPPVTLEIDGRRRTALAGESVAAAMAAAGLLRFGAAADGAPLGLACGMGACQACLVTIDGNRRARACLTPVAAGMRVDTAAHPAQGPADQPTTMPGEADVAVIGAGPAGLAAARRLAAAGRRVVVLDERPSPGGQYYKPLAASHRFRDGAGDRQFRDGAALVAAAEAAGAVLVGAATVWDARAGEDGRFRLAVDRHGRSHLLTAGSLLIATGAIERPWPVPGWTLPGAMTTGAAQTLARAYRVSPGRRILIAGNGPLNLQLAAELVAGGARVVAVAEAAGHPATARLADQARLLRFRPDLARDGLAYLARLAAARVPVLWRHVLTRVTGDGAASGAVLARLDADGAVVAGSDRHYEADCVAMGYGFQPAGEIARLLGCAEMPDPRGSGLPVTRLDAGGRTSVPGVFMAGDCAGAWGAGHALAQGDMAAAAILAGEDRPAAARRQREQAFQTALWRVFAARLPPVAALADATTVICRCEGLRRGDLEAALAVQPLDLPAVKRRTRCGMGPCQGRYCLPLVHALAGGAALPIVQAPVKPVGVASIAACAGPPPSPRPPAAPVPVPTPGAARAALACDVLIVGGGVIGVCAAHALAAAGVEAVVVEARGAVAAEASGANAGSLHVQSLAYTVEDFDTPAVRAAMAMLPLQRDAAHLWRALGGALGTDIEAEITGGICVADDAAGLAKLARKAALERAAGIDVTEIGPDEARRLMPGLSGEVLGATYSADEGKLNPLLAVPAVAAAAASAGALFHCGSPVTAIRAEGDGYAVATTTTDYRARHLVIAAGSGTAQVAGLLGLALPVAVTPLQMIVTERVPPQVGLLVSHVSRRLTVKQARAGNLIIGGGWRCGTDGTGRARPEVAGLGGNLDAAARTLPGLAGAAVIRSWVAVNGLPQRGPMIGELPGLPRCWIAATLNGLTLGPVFGRLLADLVRGRKPDWDVSAFAPARLLQRE